MISNNIVIRSKLQFAIFVRIFLIRGKLQKKTSLNAKFVEDRGVWNVMRLMEDTHAKNGKRETKSILNNWKKWEFINVQNARQEFRRLKDVIIWHVQIVMHISVGNASNYSKRRVSVIPILQKYAEEFLGLDRMNDHQFK